tara:strand:- start:56 stop:670 length:615 start_codon:yes stop_codon:yes gene_type:complete
MRIYSYHGRWKKDAQGNYKPWGAPPPGGQWKNPGAIKAYGEWYTQYRKANPGKSTTAFVSYDDFAKNYKGGGYTSPQGAMGQQSSVPQAKKMTLAGKYKRDAEGNYSPWAPPGVKLHPASTAYAGYLTKMGGLAGINKNPGSYVSETEFAKQYRDSEGTYGGPQSTFSQQPQSKQNPQMQGYIQQIQQQIQQLQKQLQQFQQGY